MLASYIIVKNAMDRGVPTDWMIVVVLMVLIAVLIYIDSHL